MSYSKLSVSKLNEMQKDIVEEKKKRKTRKPIPKDLKNELKQELKCLTSNKEITITIPYRVTIYNGGLTNIQYYHNTDPYFDDNDFDWRKLVKIVSNNPSFKELFFFIKERNKDFILKIKSLAKEYGYGKDWKDFLSDLK